MEKVGIQFQPLVAILVSSLIATRAYRKKSLDLSGAISGFIVMTINIAAGYRCAHAIRFAPIYPALFISMLYLVGEKKNIQRKKCFFSFGKLKVFNLINLSYSLYIYLR